MTKKLVRRLKLLQAPKSSVVEVAVSVWMADVSVGLTWILRHALMDAQDETPSDHASPFRRTFLTLF